MGEGEKFSESSSIETLAADNTRLTEENERLIDDLIRTRARLDVIENSTTWRMTKPLRLLIEFARSVVRGGGLRRAAAITSLVPLDDKAYLGAREKIEAYRRIRRRELRVELDTIAVKPTISLVMCVVDAPETLMFRSVDSIRSQIFLNWRLCIVDCGSVAPHMVRTLASFESDSRISVLRLDRKIEYSAALRSGFDSVTGTYIGFLEAGDALASDALLEMAASISKQPNLEIIYTDEDLIGPEGKREQPRFKTDWNPDLLLTQPYFGGLTIFSRALVERVGGIRDGFPRAEDYDLALRAVRSIDASQIAHVAAVLFHRGGQSSDSDSSRAEACRRALVDHLSKCLAGASVLPIAEMPSSNRVKWPHGDASVSIIIPTRDRAALLETCVEGILQTGGENIELIILDNESREASTKELFNKFCRDARIRIIPSPGRFNWSELNNKGAQLSSGNVLLLLNNDIQIIDSGWRDELVSQAMRPEIGAVGAKLLFPNGTVQHAGMWIGPDARARHLMRLSSDEDPGYLGQLVTARNVSAVTGACLAIRRGLFFEVGGLDERLRIQFNDVDLCLRLWERGYRVLYTPHAKMRHLESATRGRFDYGPERKAVIPEHDLLRNKWGARLDFDPFMNPNLDLIGEEVLALRFPPRESSFQHGQFKASQST